MEFFNHIFSLPLAEWVADIHGLLATLALLVFGAIIAIALLLKRNGEKNLHKPLTCLLGIQTLLVGAVSAAGIVAYVAYRTPGGAREFLLNSTETNWLHSIVFEYKEYLCGITPWLLMIIAFFVAVSLGQRLHQNKAALNFILAGTVVSTFFQIITTVLATLVGKIAPLQKFTVGGDIFSRGGNIVILVSAIVVISFTATFWLITRGLGRSKETPENYNSIAAIMYGSAVGLTLMWALDIAKEAIAPLKTSLAYINSVGPYSGVLIWSLVATLVASIIIRLATIKAKPLSLNTAGWVLISCALIQIVTFFPPFYHLFIG